MYVRPVETKHLRHFFRGNDVFPAIAYSLYYLVRKIDVLQII